MGAGESKPIELPPKYTLHQNDNNITGISSETPECGYTEYKIGDKVKFQDKEKKNEYILEILDIKNDELLLGMSYNENSKKITYVSYQDVKKVNPTAVLIQPNPFTEGKKFKFKDNGQDIIAEVVRKEEETITENEKEKKISNIILKDGSGNEYKKILAETTFEPMPSTTKLSNSSGNKKYILEDDNKYRFKYAKYKAKYLMYKNNLHN